MCAYNGLTSGLFLHVWKEEEKGKEKEEEEIKRKGGKEIERKRLDY